MEKHEVLEKWELCKTHYQTLYDDCETDWKFLHGEGQWDNEATKARKDSAKPCLVLNQLLPYAQQIVNDIRQARISIRVSPVDDNADIDTADIYQGIIRNIERQSDANTAYTTASLYAVGAGIGWIKIKTDYADTDTFDQEAYIERVLDFTSVYPDPNFKSIDGRDMEYGFVIDKISHEMYEELYDRAPVGFDDDRCIEGEVSLAQFFYKYYKSDTLYKIMLVDGSEHVVNGEQKQALDESEEVAYEILMERKVKVPYVKHCLYDGYEDPIEESEFPSDYVPLIPVFGEEVFIDGKREFHSLIRQAKDAQKMYNYHKSEETYAMALQPRNPIIGPKGSFKSYPNKWANLNKDNVTYAEYDLVYDKNGQRAEAPTRQPPVQGSNAITVAAESARQDIRLAIGMPQANMGERGNEVSGIAIRNRQIEGDNATFHFVDNLSASISQVGRILVDIIPRIYSERTIARIIGEDGEEKNVPINVPYVKQEGQIRRAKQGENYTGIYDLKAGKYDVVCDVGASYSSKRQETADKMMQLIGAQPELVSVIGDLVVEATDLPMAKEIAERLRSVMDPALLGEDPQAAKLQQASEAIKKLEDQLLNYQAALDDKKKNEQFEQHVKLKELQIEAEKTQADIAKTQAEIEKMRAETQGFNIEAVQALGGAVQGLAAQVNDIGGAVSEILSAKEREALEMDEPMEANETED